MYYNVTNLYLELTRACTLECKHCLKGDREPKSMSLETIENALKGVGYIELLSLTGGEPLLAINQIKKVIEIIKRNKIYVRNISIITNGTVLNNDIIDTLRELSGIGKLDIGISNDIFHLLALEKHPILMEMRNVNIPILQRELGAGLYDFSDQTRILPIGKAKNLTQEELNEINSKYSKKYCFRRSRYNEPWRIIPTYKNGYIGTNTTIDVNGNVTKHEIPYEEEDALALEGDFNVNNVGLGDAVINFANNYRESLARKGEVTQSHK